MIHHYLLTRFNLALWREDKAGKAIDRRAVRKANEAFRDLLLAFCGWTDLSGI